MTAPWMPGQPLRPDATDDHLIRHWASRLGKPWTDTAREFAEACVADLKAQAFAADQEEANTRQELRVVQDMLEALKLKHEWEIGKLEIRLAQAEAKVTRLLRRIHELESSHAPK